MFIKVVPIAAVVVHPVTRQPIPKEGIWVDDEQYWRRREFDGDITVLASAREKPAAEEVSTTKAEGKKR